MFDQAQPIYEKILADIRTAGLFKEERVIESPQGSHVVVGAKRS